MNPKISPIIKATELLSLYDKKNLIIVDVSNGKNSREIYLEKHLDKAIFLDLNSQLSDIDEDFANGGRHPLPKIENFKELLKSIGISEKNHVVIYDDKNGANAGARFWWLLRAVGHENVQVLDGGIQEAEKVGFPISNKIEKISKTTESYKANKWILPIAKINEVEENSQSDEYIVIDVRESNRYSGEIEPIDLIAGHIPGTINIPFLTNLDVNGLFLHPNQLKKKYQEVFGDKKSENIIIHCGSGVTACHTILSIDYAGLEIPKLYVGSWSEWSRNNKK